MDQYNKSYDIQILKEDESTIKLLAERSVLYSLSDEFRFRPSGYMFAPKYKNKVWDGYIRMLNAIDGTIPSGLYRDIIKACKTRNFSIDPSCKNDWKLHISDEEIKEYFDSLIIYDNEGGTITPYDYQYETVAHCLKEQRVTLLSPTNSGKSLQFYMMMKFMLDKKLVKNILITVPTTTLVDQLAENFIEYSPKDKTDVFTNNVHTIYAGKDKNTNKAVTVTTWQSVSKLNASFFKKYDMVIVDEAHGARGQELQNIMKKCGNAWIRIGATGTLDEEIVTEMQLRGCFGPIYQSTTTHEMIEAGQSTKLDINCVIIQHNETDCKQFHAKKIDKTKKYAAEIKYLITHKKRNSFIANLAITRDNNTLVLFNNIEHGKLLMDELKRKNPDKKIRYVDGSIDTDIRNDIKKECEENNDIILLATYATFSTGISIKNLHYIIFASPSKGRIRILQSIGRLLRKLAGKNVAKLYDISDDIRVNKNDTENYSLTHFKKRLKYYIAEKHCYKISNIKF